MRHKGMTKRLPNTEEQQLNLKTMNTTSDLQNTSEGNEREEQLRHDSTTNPPLANTSTNRMLHGLPTPTTCQLKTRSSTPNHR
jgi:hypothetical protein